MSAHQQSDRTGEKKVHKRRNIPGSSKTTEITVLPNPGSPESGNASPPSPPSPPESIIAEKTECGFFRRFIHACNRCLTRSSPTNEDEIVKDEPDYGSEVILILGYLFSLIGMAASIALFFSRKAITPDSKISAINISPEIPVIFLALFLCTLVSHKVPRGSFSNVPQFAPRKRERYTEIEDDGKDINPFIAAAGISGKKFDQLSVPEMLNLGMTVQDLLHSGKTVQYIYSKGVPVKMMYAAEIPVLLIYEAGATVQEMYDAEIPVYEMYNAGISADALIEGGVPAEIVIDVALSAGATTAAATSAESSDCPSSEGISPMLM